MGEESLTLKVAEALQDEVGYGRGRLDTVTRNELGLSIGDIVEIPVSYTHLTLPTKA